MKVQTIKLGEISPYWRNPRDNAAAVEAVKDSITRFGFNSPLILDKNRVIIAGHTRYKALVELGHTSAPCIVVDLPPQEAKAYRIADNKAGEMAEWDMSKLIPELREIGDAVDMSLYFPDEDLDALLAEAGGAASAGPTQHDIDAAAEKAENRFKGNASPDQVSVICPGCGETSFIPRDHLLRELNARVES